MASETSKLEIAIEVQCSPHKFYEKIKYALHHLPMVLPDLYKSSEIVEGDGESVGTVRLWKYILPGTTELLTCKEKVEVVDDENMWLILTVFEGDLTEHYDTFLVKVHVIPKDEGCEVFWSVEYKKCADHVSDPHLYLDQFVAITESLSAHLLDNSQKFVAGSDVVSTADGTSPQINSPLVTTAEYAVGSDSVVEKGAVTPPPAPAPAE